MPHPHLWPAIIGAVLGFILLAWACWALFRRWDKLRPRTRWLLVTLIALVEIAYWLNVYAWLIEPNRLVVRHVEIVSEDWRGAPITIAALTDTHFGSPHMDAARMGRIVRRVNQLRPDLVVLLGDYAGGRARETELTGREQQEVLGAIATFAAFTPRYGVIGVLGNQDNWYGRSSIARAMEEAGVATLVNRNVEIQREGGAFFVAGLGDAYSDEADFDAALDGVGGNDSIVISHSPIPFRRMPAGPALMLAGHTHCGQVSVPFFGRPFLPIRNHRHGCHLVQENGRTMYVSGGLGTSIVPARFLNPPEIVLITLRSASPDAPPSEVIQG